MEREGLPAQIASVQQLAHLIHNTISGIPIFV
jgi:hypothetical protein